jgi:hypothetical protein
VSDSIRVYVNARVVDVPRGSTVQDVLQLWDADEANAVASGERKVTDSRGLPASLRDAVTQGSILRVVGSRATR